MKRYWGWPVGKYLGGHNVKSFLKDKMGDRYKISKDDAHPNAKGHELIAKELHDHNML
jgi:lysophospholipase L1-like esterase